VKRDFVRAGLGLLRAKWCCVSLVLIEVLLHFAVEEGLRDPRFLRALYALEG